MNSQIIEVLTITSPIALPFQKFVKLVLKLKSYFLQAKNLIAIFVEQRSPQSKELFFLPQLTLTLRNKCLSILLENGFKQFYINWQVSSLHVHNLCKSNCSKTFASAKYSYYPQRLILLVLKKKTHLAMT